MKPVVSVLGAGNGGQALAGHLALKGYSVKLFEHPDFGEKVSVIESRGGIELRGNLKGFGKLEKTTTNAGEALAGADVVYVTAPSFAQKPIMDKAGPYIDEGMKVVFIPGNFGSLEAASWLNAGKKEGVLLGETNTLPYACRQIEPGIVDIWGVKTKVLMAALPSKRNEELIQTVKEMFPTDIVKMSNVLETSFSNLNMVLHCPTMILNTGRIESREAGFRSYTDGMTPSVCKISEITDEERISIGRALGLNLQPQTQWLKETYGLEGGNLFEVLQGSDVYGGHGVDAPKTMTHRYLTEDVPYLLVPVASFGRALGVPCPVIESIILLAGKINGKDYFSEGRTLERMGFPSTGIESIREKLLEGA